MKKLYAIFEINLPSRVLIQWPNEQSIQLQFTHDIFDIELKLRPEEGGAGSQRKGEVYWTKCVDKIFLKVGRNEVEEVPDIFINERGYQDLSKRRPYFNKRLPEYREVALRLYMRCIKYFKYVLKNPFLDEFHYNEYDFANPTWVDEMGAELSPGEITFFSEPVPGMDGEKIFGIKKFCPDLENDLMKILKNDLTPDLYEEILADAQSAIFEGNYRRGVLEMAIASELVIKQAFFAKTTPAGSAFEYLEDKGKVHVSILEFISRVSEEALGVSFKEEYPVHYMNIEHLFRCRNKIAHRGKALFRDDTGKLHNPDKDILNEWWCSVDMLLNWISKNF